TYYWFPKMSGRMLDEGIGRIVFWLMVVGFNLTFLPMHILGLMGMARRTYTYPDLPGYGPINFAETIGAFIMAVAVLLLVWDVVRTLRNGAIASDNPWNGWTLEWATSSPPPAMNFVTVPPITSSRPIYRAPGEHSSQGAVEAAVGNLPGAAGVEQAVAAADRTRDWPAPVVGILAFIFSEATFFGALIVAFLEYRTRNPGPGPHDLDVPRTFIFSLFLFASSGTVYLAERRLAREDRRGFLQWWIASIVLGAIFLVGQLTEYASMYAENIRIDTNLFSSSFFTLTGFHGFHVFVGLIALSVVALLAAAGDFVGGRRRVVVDTVSIYWHFVDGVWVVIFSLVYLLGLVA
ncbi:MAG: cbb3-type cytochrome c oxidase subunit I, partial [Mycobacterium sp.]|nr:cbb3-type cytochrome c oxidase subunit I [Mycobacterium sp.]